ncbi:hypothetical protein D3C73_1382720 [compost metagenome]
MNLLAGVQGPNPLEHLTNQRIFCRIDKALRQVPLRQSGQTHLQGVGRQRIGVSRQVSGDLRGGRRQQPAPLLLEMLKRAGVTALGVGALAGQHVAVNRQNHAEASLKWPLQRTDGSLHR